jgi:hypothetical protein
MFLYPYPHYNSNNSYACFAPSSDAEQYMLKRLSRNLVIADWQYDSRQSPVETAAVFAKAGLDCLLCPWDRGMAQMRSVFMTAKDHKLIGFLHTTWHTLSQGMPYVALAAIGGFENIDECEYARIRTQAAALLRKVAPAGGDYKMAGWSKLQVDNLW